MEIVSTQHIANAIKKLRKERALSQAELSRALKVSQSQLSLIENAKGSLNAEQLLALCVTYNLGLNDFLSAQSVKSSPEDELQNALALAGASHLLEIRGVVVEQRLRDVHEIIFDVISTIPSSRMLTSLAPVIFKNFDKILFQKLYQFCGDAGCLQRLLWVLAQVQRVILKWADQLSTPREKRDAERKARILATYYEVFKSNFYRTNRIVDGDKNAMGEDLLSARYLSARSRKGPQDPFSHQSPQSSLDELRDQRDDVAREWNIITDIKTEHFFEAFVQAQSL